MLKQPTDPKKMTSAIETTAEKAAEIGGEDKEDTD